MIAMIADLMRKTSASKVMESITIGSDDTFADQIQVRFPVWKRRNRVPISCLWEKAHFDVVQQAQLHTLLVRNDEKLAESDR